MPVWLDWNCNASQVSYFLQEFSDTTNSRRPHSRWAFWIFLNNSFYSFFYHGFFLKIDFHEKNLKSTFRKWGVKNEAKSHYVILVKKKILSMFSTLARSIFKLGGKKSPVKCSSTVSTAAIKPRLISTGFAPWVTRSNPDLAIALAKTVAVVVPSPAFSFVLFATSWTSLAPIFWNLSFNSTAFATVTPSLVILGLPHEDSIITFRP